MNLSTATAAPAIKPTSADELMVQARVQFEGLSRQLRIIARYVEANRQVIGLDGVQDFASKCGVQPSAIVRFAKQFGFSGFSEMQALFRDEVAQKLNARPDYQDRIRVLKKQGSAALGAEQVRAEVIRASVDGLRALESHDPNATELHNAVKLMAGADALWLVASRRSFPVGAYLSYALQQTEKPIRWLNGLGHMQHGEMRSMQKHDVMVAISFDPYAKETLEAVETAIAKGVKVVAITDSKFSPIAKRAACTLLAYDGAPYGFRTLTSTLCVAQALFINVAYALEGSAARVKGRS